MTHETTLLRPQACLCVRYRTDTQLILLASYASGLLQTAKS